MADEVADAPVQQGDPTLTVDQFAAKIKAKYPQYAQVDNAALTDKILAKYPQYSSHVNVPIAKMGNIPTADNLTQQSNIPYTPQYADAHQQAINVAKTQQQLPPQQPKPQKEDGGILDKVSQAMYLPAFNQGFNELVTKPLSGANDFVDRTIDKVYTGITGEQTPSWLRKGSGLDNIVKYYDDAYQNRDKPKNIVSDIAEGAVGTVPLMASLFTGSGEASLVAKAPEFISKATKLLGVTGAANAYKDATDNGKDYGTSALEAAKGELKGNVQGLTLDAQMLVGNAFGKGLVDELAARGVKMTGKAGDAVLHALATGTVFGSTAAGSDLLQGKDIDAHEAMKQFGMGLMFELPAVAKGLNEHLEGKKINDNAAKLATASTAISNMNAESTLRTLMNTPPDQLEQINSLPGTHDELYASSIEQGAKAYEAEDLGAKNNHYANQMLLKTQADVKLIADKVADPESRDALVQSITDSNELPPETKQDLLDKIAVLTPKIETTKNQEDGKNEMGEQPGGQEVGQSGNGNDEKSISQEISPKENGQEKVNAGAENAPLHQVDIPNESEIPNKTQPTKVEENAPEIESPRALDVGEQAQDSSTMGSGNAEQVEPAQQSKESQPEEKDQEVKKTILTKRAYEGEISPEVKKHLEEKGLTRKSFSQEERSNQAADFIGKFGDEASQKAIESGDVDGAMAASILTQLQIKNNREMSELSPDSPEHEDLAKKNADLIELAEKKGYLGGEFNGQLAYEYQNSELNYASMKRQVEKSTGKKLSNEQDVKIKKLSDANEDLKKQLADSESRLVEETDKAFKAGHEAEKNESKAQKAKRIADKIRGGKLSRPGIFSSATPASVVWDGAVEVVAKSVEAGGKLADAIDEGIEHIKKSDWYKNLSNGKKKQAEDEFKSAHYETSGSTDLSDLQERFINKNDNKFTASQAKSIWTYMKENYINNGVSYRDAIAKTSDDLGLSWRQVSEAITTPKTKRISDEMWKKQYNYNRYRIAAKNWIGEQNNSRAGKFLKSVSGLFRGIAVFGHGGIFVGTHAGMNLFNPSTWRKVIPAFFNGWKFAYGSEANYQKGMEELKNSPNYVIAQRAGLKNDPDRINTEEYQKSQKYLGKLGQAGEKGFNAIKVLRQDLFDYHFNKLNSAEQQDPEVAKSIAKIVNLATGATNLKLPDWVNEASFAGGMEASRWEKLTANPVKATRTAIKALVKPESATPAEKVFAKVWSRRVGEQLATYSTALIVNSAIQNMINPNNPVNITDPDKHDWLQFKLGDISIDPTSGMRGTAQFIYQIAKIPVEEQADLRGEDRVKLLSKKIGQHAKGKLAPFYSTLAEIYSSRDFAGNVVPWSDENPPKYAHNLSYGEYIWSKAPLPVAEAAEITYKSAIDNGGDPATVKDIIKGILSGGVSGTTGFRVEYNDDDE